MDHISSVIKGNKLANSVINVNVNNSPTNVSGDNNVTSKVGKYALDRNSFTPNTPKTKLAEEIATYFNDVGNYAFYLHVVNRLGESQAYSFFRSIQDEIKEKAGTRYQVVYPKKYFAWRFKRGYR